MKFFLVLLQDGISFREPMWQKSIIGILDKNCSFWEIFNKNKSFSAVNRLYLHNR